MIGTGIATREASIIRRPEPRVVVHEHFVQFYESDSFLLDTVSGLIAQGLVVGDASVLIATPAHCDVIEKRLKAYGLDLPRTPGRYVTLEAHATLSKLTRDGSSDEALFSKVVGNTLLRAADASPNRRVRAFGEMVALFWMEGNREAAVALEEIWDKFIKQHSVSMCCLYPLDAFRADGDQHLFLKACAQHSRVVPAESYTSLNTAEERSRSIPALQHKAKLFETETAGRKKAESKVSLRQKELTDLLEIVAEGVHQLGPDGTILWANSAQLKMLGYTRPEYLGHDIREFWIEPYRLVEFWQRLMAHQSVNDFAAELRCKDGSTKNVLIHSSGYWDGGEFLYTRCFIRDISERVQLEKELSKTIARLEETDRRKDEFLALLGHELRNPLGAVQNAIATARVDETRSGRMLEIAQRQSEQLGRLVNDLLDVARITQGKITLRKAAVNVGSIIDRAAEQSLALIESRDQQLTISIPPEVVSAQVFADSARLQQVIGNLVHNAAKFTQQGGRIEIAAELNGKEVVVRIRDNGPGLSPEVLPRVFDLFEQADNSLARVHGGLGLGLTLVKRLVEMHDGRVHARSDGLGKGSEFDVRLPMHCGANTSDDRIPRKPATLSISRILIVEDNADAAESLRMLLELSGHKVTLASKGLDAVEAVRVGDFDVALVDIGLPDITGYEVARRIRELTESNSNRIAMAALTGYGQQRDKELALSAGFDRHFVKPVDIGQLREFVARRQRAEC